MSSGVSEAAHESPVPARPAGAAAPAPFKSPTYPQRTHVHERTALEGRLHSLDERIRAAERQLNAVGSDPRRAAHERCYGQMLGARDQVAEAVRRLPMETGDLYEEDHERLEQAIQAFERVWRKWEAEAEAEAG